MDLTQVKREDAPFFGAFHERIVWAKGRSLYWEDGPGQSDFQSFPDGGDIIGIESGYKHGFIILERARIKVTPTDDEFIYQFDVVEKGPQRSRPL